MSKRPSLDTSPQGLIRLFAYVVLSTGATVAALHTIVGMLVGFGEQFAPWLIAQDLGLVILGWITLEFSDAQEGARRPWALPLWILTPYVIVLTAETGGTASPYVFLLLVIAVFAGLIHSGRAAVLLTATMSALYGFSAWLIPSGTILRGDLDSILQTVKAGRSMPLDEITSLATHSAFFFLGMVLAMRLARTFKAEVDSLAERATRDPLTGMPNRRGFEEKMAQEFQRAQRFAWPIAVLVVDLDHFKRVNDSFGHAFGDQVLKQASQILRSTAGPMDHLGRSGGEEFAIGAVAAEPGHGEELARRVVRAFREFSWRAMSPNLKVTCSVGVAVLTPAQIAQTGAAGLPMLLEQADQALYDVKASGRDNYKVYGSTEHTPLTEIPGAPDKPATMRFFRK